MADFDFSTTAGETVDRELLVAYLNTGTSSAPAWSPLGKRVEDSSEDVDWGKETKQDILGETYTTLKKPVITQSFDPLPLDASDVAAKKIWNLAVVEQNAAALANLDMLIAHYYADSGDAKFGERYSSCAAEMTGLGGEGGGVLTISTEITYGGTRTKGTVSNTGGTVTFTAD